METNPLILIIDDDEGVLHLFQEILRTEKYTVLTARSGREALELVGRKRPALAILDLKMPDMTGIHILRRIKEQDDNIEVIIITAYGAIRTARMAMRLGAYEYITKPFDIDYIKEVVRNALATAQDGGLQQAGDEERRIFRKET